MHISAKVLREADDEGQLPQLAAILTQIHLNDLQKLDLKVNRLAGNPLNEARPLSDDGEDFAVVEANVPMALAMEFHHRKGWGPETFSTDAGMKEFLRCYPQFRCKTVSGKPRSGYTGKEMGRGGTHPYRRRVTFGRGTIEFAR